LSRLLRRVGVGWPKQKPRVLCISHDLGLTGAPLVLLHLGELLAAGGWEIELARLRAEPAHPELVRRWSRHAREISLPSPLRPRHLLDRYAAIIANTTVCSAWLTALLRHPDQQQLRARLAQRTVWWIHEIDPRYLVDGLGGPLDSVGQVVFDSRSGQACWQAAGRTSNSRVIYPAVPRALLDRRDCWLEASALRARLEIPVGDVLFLAAGSTNRHKGQREILAAFAAFASRRGDVHLAVVGLDQWPESVFLRDQRAALAPALARRIHLLEATPDLAPLYRAADVFVMNTLPPGEMFGCVTAEAMAFELPVLASREGASSELVLDEVTGLLHDWDDLAAIASAMDRLGASAELRSRLGRAGGRRALDFFHPDTMQQEWLELLDQLSSRGASPPAP
jgi:glycosyltransferase involved in cell wall biosynthesis